MPEFENASLVCLLEDLMGLRATKASVSMNSSTHGMGRRFGERWTEDAECFEDDMTEYNSWTRLGTSMDRFPGCQTNLADN